MSESEPSFPSGHATDSAAFYLALAFIVAVFVLRRPLVRAFVVVGAALLTIGIGVSRLVLGVHWPTDVIAGWSLGTVAALLVTVVVLMVTRLTPPDPASAAMPRVRLMWILRSRRRLGFHTSHDMT